MTWTVAGSVVAIVGVVLLLIGAYRGGRANDEAHAGLAQQIAEVKADVATKASAADVADLAEQVAAVKADVATKASAADFADLRTEMRDGFRAIGEQIAALSSSSGGDAPVTTESESAEQGER